MTASTDNPVDYEEAVSLLLRQSTALAALLYGNLIGDSAVQGWRIYPDLAPQGTLWPCVVYHEVSELPAETADGPGLSTARVQVDAYSPARFQALQVLGAIDACLCPRQQGSGGFSRIVTLSSGDRVLVQAVRPDVRRSYYENQSKVYRRGRDYKVTASAA